MPSPSGNEPSKKDATSSKLLSLSALTALAVTTMVTTGVGSLFQYVSWRNSTKLEVANTRVIKANELYERIALSIGERYYSTLLYLAATRDFVNAPSSDSELQKFHNKLNHERLQEFYKVLRSWNENYDKLLTSVDFVFDGPVGVIERVENGKLNKISCDLNIVEQFAPQKLNYNSLKIQFAAINHCFAESIIEFSAERDHALVDASYRINEKKKQEANIAINNVAAMANEFRCHALFRLQYFQAAKQGLVSPVGWFNKNEFDTSRSEAFFSKAWQKCKLTKD